MKGLVFTALSVVALGLSGCTPTGGATSPGSSAAPAATEPRFETPSSLEMQERVQSMHRDF